MKGVWISLALVAIVGVLQAGCKDACQNADDRIVARYKECKLTVSRSGTSGSEATTCSAADADYFDCRADCAESATCEALHGTDTLGAADFNQCNLDCK